MNAQSQWNRLINSFREKGRQGQYDTINSKAEIQDGNILFTLGKDLEYAILIPIGDTRINFDKVSDALYLESVTLENNQAFLLVQCGFTELNEYFGQFIDALLKNADKSKSAFDVFTETYTKFKDLLSSHSASVSREIVAGLIGELHVLTVLGRNNSQLITNWYGPDKEHHDIVFSGLSIEVKTSQRCGDTKVKISSLSQLDSPNSKPLYLWHVNLNRDPEGELTVATLCKKLIDMGQNETLLREKLAEMKCFDFTAEEWNKLSYSACGEDEVYIVDNAFPKITVDTIGANEASSAIREVEYVVDLAYLENFKQDFASFLDGINS